MSKRQALVVHPERGYAAALGCSGPEFRTTLLQVRQVAGRGIGLGARRVHSCLRTGLILPCYAGEAKLERNNASRAGYATVDLEAPRTRLVVRVLGAGSDWRVGKGSGSKRSNGSIRVQKHARRCGLRAYESKFARGAVRKETFACDQQHRVDKQQNLVDQRRLEQNGT